MAKAKAKKKAPKKAVKKKAPKKVAKKKASKKEPRQKKTLASPKTAEEHVEKAGVDKDFDHEEQEHGPVDEPVALSDDEGNQQEDED